MTGSETLADRGSVETLETLWAQRRAWDARPLVRRLYTGWFDEIAHRLAQVSGATVELGAGCGAFKEYMAEAIATDVVPSPWSDQVVDAEALPFADESLGNLVMVDVFHHVPDSASALREAERTLTVGGRLVLLEPYCSPVSGLVYRYLHHEGADLEADLEVSQSSGDPFDANNALPTLLFWRRGDLVRRWTPRLRIVERSRFAWLAYPLSGGFTKPQLLPSFLVPLALVLERVLNPLMAPVLAFRCLVVLEKVRVYQ